MGVWYCTREDVLTAADIKEAYDNFRQVDQAIESASRQVEGLCHRIFYPVLGTRYFPWPDQRRSASWRLWLDENELISVTTVVSGGQTLSPSDYFLEPVNSGPPYRSIETSLASTYGAFAVGATTQRAIEITGLWGHSNVEKPAGLLAEALDGSETDVEVSDSFLIGVGSLIRIDNERMIVTDKAPLDTGVNLGANLDVLMQDQQVSVASGAAFHVGETIIIGAERMFIRMISGNTLTVRRAVDGSVLDDHTAGDDIYALRLLTVERGALGTTAASHLISAPIARWTPPGLLVSATKAEAIHVDAQEHNAYGRRTGSDEAERDSGGMENSAGMGLPDIRYQLRTRYGRKARKGVV